MSLKTWEKKYYRVPAWGNKAVSSELNAVKHCLKKWKGLKEKNLNKHNLYKNDCGITEEKGGFNGLDIDVDSCALCNFHHLARCTECILYKEGFSCNKDGSPYDVWHRTGNPRPMIKALKHCRTILNVTEGE